MNVHKFAQVVYTASFDGNTVLNWCRMDPRIRKGGQGFAVIVYN